MRQIQTLLNPGESIPDDLVVTWIWWFNLHQPAEGRLWVPQLAWAPTLVAPPADRRPAPAAGGRDRASPQPRAIGIRGNEKADQLADLGRRKSRLLFGRMSVSPRPEEEEEERELLEGEASVWGYEEEPPLPEEDCPPTPYQTPGTPRTPQATPKRQV